MCSDLLAYCDVDLGDKLKRNKKSIVVHTVEYPYFSEKDALLYSLIIEFLLISLVTLANVNLDTYQHTLAISKDLKKF